MFTNMLHHTDSCHFAVQLQHPVLNNFSSHPICSCQNDAACHCQKVLMIRKPNPLQSPPTACDSHLMQSPAAGGKGADSSAMCLQVAPQLQRLTSPPHIARTVKVSAMPISTKEPKPYCSLLLQMQLVQVAQDCLQLTGMTGGARHI